MKSLDRVRAVIADALYVDVADVTKDSLLMKDLGAESIDFLDIMFRLEKEFGIKLPKGDIERRARGGLSEAEFAADGKLTPAALANLKAMMPEVDPGLIRPGLLLRDIPSLFTVLTFARMVDLQLFGATQDSVLTGESPEQAAGSRM
jgi:acyl carrier protein